MKNSREKQEKRKVIVRCVGGKQLAVQAEKQYIDFLFHIMMQQNQTLDRTFDEDGDCINE